MCVYIYIRTYIHAYSHIHVHITQTYIHAYIHKYLHTSTHTYHSYAKADGHMATVRDAGLRVVHGVRPAGCAGAKVASSSARVSYVLK